MPEVKPTKAPLIIFGGVLGISIVCVAIVLVTHSRRTEPYLDTKMRRVRTIVRPAPVEPPAPQPIPLVRPEAIDAATGADASMGSRSIPISH